MSTIFLKLRGQSGFELSSDQGIQVNYTKDFALPTFSGILYAGDDKQFVGGFDSVTINLAAVFADYSVKTDTIQWSQVSGESGSFSSPNKLETLFSTAASNVSAVSLRVTITRTTVGGSIQVFDELALSDQPFDATSSKTIFQKFKIDQSGSFFNPSWVGSNDQSSDRFVDIIYWRTPEKNGGFVQRGTYNYLGYRIQKFNKTFSTWYDVESGDNTTNSYTVTDFSTIYRYLPIWGDENGRKVTGTSVKFLKPSDLGNQNAFGIYELSNPKVSPSNYFINNTSTQKFTVSIQNINELEFIDPDVITQNLITSDQTANRYSNTLTGNSFLDADKMEPVKQSFDLYSLNVTRTLGTNIIDIGN